MAFARRLIAEPGVAGVPGSSFYSRPELGRTKLRFAFPKRHETLRRRGRPAGLDPPRLTLRRPAYPLSRSRAMLAAMTRTIP